MNNSFLYHALGLYTLKYTRIEYKGNTIILNVESKTREKRCPKCRKYHLVKNGYRTRDFLGLPIGNKKIIIRMKIQRYKYKDCDYDQQERISFANGSQSYTFRFAKYVIDLLRSMTLKDVAGHLGVSWDLVKEIHLKYLSGKYGYPSLEGVENIGIDESAVKKGKDMFDKQFKTRLDNALAMNKSLSQAYYLKEMLHEIWTQLYKKDAEKVLLDWVEQARGSKVTQLLKMANVLMAHRTGILAWYDCHLSTGKVEGINNKIKVMKRNAYGFRDDKYFKLRLYALHDCRITLNVG